MTSGKKTLIVIDANAVIHRAYHALPPLTTEKGELVNAIYGFFLVFLRAWRELKPDFVAVAFDFPAPSFRHKIYQQYKATREKAPEELYQQIPKVKNILQKIGVQVFEKEGYEADDAIATVARAVSQEKTAPETIILSGDADTLQLVGKNTKVYFLRKGVKDIVLYDAEKVKEKYGGLGPEKLADFKGLRGDPSDNIPGVFGVGEKTAISLISEFNSLENIYKTIEKGGKESGKIKDSLRKKLLDYKTQAFVSKELGELNKNVPIDFDLEQCRWILPERKEEVIKILNEYNFVSLVKRLEQENGREGAKKETGETKKEKTATVKNNLRLW